MSLSREEIVKEIKNIVPTQRLILDEQELKRSSIDRFRKVEGIFGIWSQPLPVAVVKVENTDEVSQLLKFCNQNKINVIPRTGRTATEGGLETIVKDSIVIDGSLMNQIIKIDKQNMQATCGCGVVLQTLEDEVRALGLTTGHSPQSKPLAQMGGLTATRSIGQFSTYYGAMEDMLVGLEAVFPDGEITRVKNVPRRSAGPDIRNVVMGNEGTLCFITEVTVKLFSYYPESIRYCGYTFDEKDMDLGFRVLREIITSGFKPSVSRIYDPEDAKQHWTGKNWWSPGKGVLIFTTEGPEKISKATMEGIEEIISRHKQFAVVESVQVKNWIDNLNWGQDKIDKEFNDIKETKIVGHTTEVSGDWEAIVKIYHNCIRRVKEEFPYAKDLRMLGGHSSHSYINGTNMYFVYDYEVNCSPEDECRLYHDGINNIICDEVLKQGGSICHHHGMGKGRARFAKKEHGTSFYMLEKLKKAFDPNDIMNKGVIFSAGKR